MNVSVFDFHCDTASGLVGWNGQKPGSLWKNSGHIDLERASKLAGYAQCFACFTTPLAERWCATPARESFQLQLAAIGREVERNQDRIAFAASPGMVEENRKNGKMSAILTMEGTAGIEHDAARLQEMWNLGFRVVSLGWNEKNVLTGSHVTGGGLTDMGKEFVKEAQRLGFLVDVSHISDEGFWDMMKIANGPIIATHSNSRSVWNNSRNLTDDMFRAIVQTGGVAGYNACDEFTGENPDLDTICDHILHFLELDPSGKHIALGGDLDGIEKTPAGFEGVQSWPVLADQLVKRGLTRRQVENIFWNNAIGVMELAVCDHAK